MKNTRYLLFVILYTGMATLLTGQVILKGTILDNTGQPLPGTTVQMVNSATGTTTDTAGYYELPLPIGRAQIVYSFLGYGSRDTVVRGGYRDTMDVSFVLQEDVMNIPEVIVYGRLARGQAQALGIQRSSANLQNIVHSELFNRYPDVNLAETVQRLPGVNITRDQGEGEFVRIRGLPEQYTLISLNGQRLPSLQPAADRAAGLDLIQSNLIEEVRLIKSLTPDLDADAIGGTVDFRLKEPDRRWDANLQAGIGYNVQQSQVRDLSRRIVQGTGYLNQELSENAMYLVLAGSYFQTGRGTVREDYRYALADDDLDRFRVTDLDNNRRRYNFISNLEISPSAYHSLRLGYALSGYQDDEINRLAVYNYEDSLEDRITTNRRESRKTNLVTLDAESNFGPVKLDYALSFADGQARIPNRARFRYRRDNDYRGIDESERDDLPLQAVFDLPDLVLDTLGIDLTQVDEDIFIGGINLTMPLNPRNTSNIKGGFRYRVSDRVVGSYSEYAAPDRQLTIPSGEFGQVGVHYEEAPFLELGPDVPTQVDIYTSPDAYEAMEVIYGGYLMNTTSWNGRFNTVAGLRMEQTTHNYQQLTSTDSVESDYINWFPSVNATFRFTKSKQLRAALYTALSRPAYASLVPFQLARTEANSFILGNEDLLPTYAYNFDLTYERYGNRDGFLSAGAFGKLLNDVFLEVGTERSVNGELINVRQITNVGQAYVYGLELVWFQSLGFIDQRYRHFNINGNVSINFSGAENDFDFDRALPLVRSPRHIANLSLVYNNTAKGISIVVAGLYRGRLLERIQDTQPLYQGRATFLDISADYQLTPFMSTFLRVNNITNDATERYLGYPGDNDSLLYQRDKFGAWGTVGIRLTTI